MAMRAVFGLLAVAGLGLSMTGCDHMYGGADKALATQGLGNVGAVKRAENLYDVTYIGNDKMTGDYRRDMTLMQSAELCKSQGFKYFKASDTQAFSNHAAPQSLPGNDTPQVTLQVSCQQVQDTILVSDVDTVIARVTSQYTVN